MKVWVRRTGIIGGALIVVLLLAFGTIYGVSAARLGAEHDTTAHGFDPVSGDVVEGEHLARTYGCMDCHGTTLGGTLLIDAMPFARLPAPNLTGGRAGGALTDDQWELAVRHGIGWDGRALYIMPSSHYVYLSATGTEMRALWEYLTSLEAATAGTAN
ncbi:MAG: c-type cytochrome [Longimicrobiales bacterium]